MRFDHWMNKVGVVLALSLVGSAGRAQVPQTLTVQGVLRQASGGLESGVFVMTFKLYESQGSTTALYTEQKTVNVESGVFTAVLAPGSSTFTGSAVPTYFGVTVQGDPSGELPRQPLSTVPYAFLAGHAATAGTAAHALTADTVTSTSPRPSYVVGDTDWYPMMTYAPVSIPVATGAPDFFFAWARGNWQWTSQFTMPIMGVPNADYLLGYTGIIGGGGTVQVNAPSYVGAIRSIGNEWDVQPRRAHNRIFAFSNPADFDSGWQACAAGQTYVFQHSIGSAPEVVMVEVAQNANGSGWRVPAMSSSNYSGAWHQTALVGMTSTNLTLRTHGDVARFRNFAGTNFSATSGYCRVRGWDWAADYDSGWVAVSTTDGDRLFKHGLGIFPSMVMVYAAGSSNYSSWVVPAMGAFHDGWQNGIGVWDVTDNWIAIKGGASSVAQFVDSQGNGQGPTSGFVRVLAYR